MCVVEASQVKLRGTKAFEELLEDESEVAISVRGKVKYIVMTVEKFEYFQECERTVALAEIEEHRKKREVIVQSTPIHRQDIRSGGVYAEA